MSYYENNYFEPNMENFKNDNDGYDNEDNFYYLTENEESKKNNYIDELDNFYKEDTINQDTINQDTINQEDKSIEHMKDVNKNESKSIKDKKTKKSKKVKAVSINWIYTILAIFIIALIFYYLIDQKMFTLPDLTTSSPSQSVSVSSSSLGSTFMSLY
jgi:hypothetical protein